MFRYSRHWKNRDPVSVGRVRTSRCDCPFRPSTSRLRRLAPYCFNTAAMPPAALPLGRCAVLIAWLDDRGCVRGCLCLPIEVSCLPPLSSRGHATPPCRLSGGLGDRLRPATHSHKCWLGYRSPAGDCARLSFPVVYSAGTFTSCVWCRPMSLSCWLLGHSPFSKECDSSWAEGGLTTGLSLGVFLL